jgi:hypothetical protein
MAPEGECKDRQVLGRSLKNVIVEGIIACISPVAEYIISTQLFQSWIRDLPPLDVVAWYCTDKVIKRDRMG